MVGVLWDSVASFHGGTQNVLKIACFWVPYLRAYCEALRYPFELIFCVMVKDKFANVFPKNHAFLFFLFLVLKLLNE